MDTLRIIVFALSFHILAVAQEYKTGFDNKKATAEFVTTMQGLSEALHCFRDMMEESLRLRTHSSLTLAHIAERQSDDNTMKRDVAASHRVARIIHEIGSLDDQLEKNCIKVKDLEDKLTDTRQHVNIMSANEKHLKSTVQGLEEKLAQSRQLVNNLYDNEKRFNITVQDLEDELTDIRQHVSIMSANEKLLKSTVQGLEEKLAQSRQLVNNLYDNEKRFNITAQDLERRLHESHSRTEELEKTVQRLNDNVASQRCNAETTGGCAQHHQREIKELVQEFVSSGDWPALKRQLLPLLDSDSKAYAQLRDIQLQVINPLWTIGQSGNMELASLLLCAGLPVDLADDDGDTMLHGAAVTSNLPLVILLLDHGAEVNTRGTGWTPLIRAAVMNQLGVSQLLVRAGARTSTTDEDGHTALDYAKISNHVAVARYLEQLLH